MKMIVKYNDKIPIYHYFTIILFQSQGKNSYVSLIEQNGRSTRQRRKQRISMELANYFDEASPVEELLSKNSYYIILDLLLLDLAELIFL